MVRVFVFLLAVLSSVTASAQTLAEIVAKHVQARGGLERIQAIETMRRLVRTPDTASPAALDRTSMALDRNLWPRSAADWEVARRSPDAWYIEEARRPCMTRTTFLAFEIPPTDYLRYLDLLVTDPGHAERAGRWVKRFQAERDPESLLGAAYASGDDGALVWTWTRSRRVVTPTRTAHRCTFAAESPVVSAEAQGYTLSLVGEATVEGRRCWQIRVSAGSAPPLNVYVDQKTSLDIADEQVSGTGPVGDRRFFSNWRSVGGVMMPFSIVSGQHRAVVEKLEFNVRIDDRRFSPPVTAK
jgi:hypothetical protein